MNIKTYLIEELTRIITTELSKDDIVITTYDMSNKQDKNVVKNNIDKIWSLLQDAYKNDFRGFQSKNKLLSNSNIVRIVNVQDEIIAVSVYNNYLGGNKCVGIGATRKTKTLHNLGKISVDDILRTDLKLPQNWYWFEASGIIEKMCDSFGAIKIPSEYVHLFIKKSFEIIDDYHYLTKIDGIPVTKCIYGFKDQKTYDIVMYNMFNSYYKDIKNDEDNNIILEAFKYHLYDTEEEQVKAILDRFISMYFDDKIHYAPKDLLDKLNHYIIKMEKIIKENKSQNIKNLKICYKDAKKVQKAMKPIIIHKGLYGKEFQL